MKTSEFKVNNTFFKLKIDPENTNFIVAPLGVLFSGALGAYRFLYM